jgi:hypothetical protein
MLRGIMEEWYIGIVGLKEVKICYTTFEYSIIPGLINKCHC